ncbi:hypothetical protein EG358_06985 [Chryseobacterium indoltheticum]|nr:hypothetical protein EG358_06985 [Chryseobacterium indoltheticum]
MENLIGLKIETITRPVKKWKRIL